MLTNVLHTSESDVYVVNIPNALSKKRVTKTSLGIKSRCEANWIIHILKLCCEIQYGRSSGWFLTEENELQIPNLGPGAQTGMFPLIPPEVRKQCLKSFFQRVVLLCACSTELQEGSDVYAGYSDYFIVWQRLHR